MIFLANEDTGADLNERFTARRIATIGDFPPEKAASRVTESPFPR
ncbi:MAG: hypothetical protein WCF13_04685 [Stellaceae bacterium]